jgi:hypothetical protein
MADSIGDLIIEMHADLKDLHSQFVTALKHVNEFSGGLLEMGKIAAETLGIAFSGHELLKFSEEALEAYAAEERISIGLAHMRGSAEQATEEIEALRGQAMELGIAFEPMLRVDQQLAAFGLTAKEVTEFNQMAADSAAAMGTSFEHASSSLARIVETGNMSARVLRGLGLEAKDVANAMGVSTSQITAMGRELDEETRLAVIRLAQEMKGLSGTSEEAAFSLSAAFARWEDSVKHFKKEFGEAISPIGAAFANLGALLVTTAADAVQGFNQMTEALTRTEHAAAQFLATQLGIQTGKSPAEIAKEQAAVQEKMLGTGAFYKEQVKNIDAQTAAELNRLQVTLTVEQAKRKAAGATNEELKKLQLEEIDAEERARESARQKKMTLPKPEAQATGITNELLREQDKIAEQARTARAKVQAEVIADTAKAAHAVTQQQIKEAEDNANALLERQRTLIVKQKELGQLGATQATEQLHTVNQGLLDVADNGAKARAQLQRSEGVNRNVVQATLDRELADNRKKFQGQELETDLAYAAERQREQRAIAEEQLRAGQEMGRLYLEQEREQSEQLFKDRAIDDEERAMQRMQFQQRELTDELDYIYAKRILDTQDVNKAAMAEQVANDAEEKARAEHNTRMTAILKDYYNAQKADREAEQRARMVTLQSEVTLAASAAEQRKRIAHEEFSANQITLMQRLQVERAVDAEINTMRLQLLAVELAIAAAQAATDSKRLADVARITGQIQKLTADAASAEAERQGRLRSELERTLGIQDKMADELRVHLATLVDSYRQLDQAGRLGATTRLEAQRAELEQAILLRNEMNQGANSMVIGLANVNLALQVQQDLLNGLGNLYKDLQSATNRMWNEWGSGFARAITAGKDFGKTLMNTLHQIEEEILNVVIGKAIRSMMEELGKLLKRSSDPVLHKVGVFLAGSEQDVKLRAKIDDLIGAINRWIDSCGQAVATEGMEGRPGERPPVVPQLPHSAEATSPRGSASREAAPDAGLADNTRAVHQQTFATTMSVASSVALVGSMVAQETGNKTLGRVMMAVGTGLQLLTTVMAITHVSQATTTTALTTSNVALIAALVALNVAVDANTIALYASSLFPLQTGGTVSGTGGVRATIHAGETVASAEILRNVGEGLANSMQPQDLGGNARALQGIGAKLTAAAPKPGMGNVVNSFDGAVFHGVPDQHYVSQIMDSAVGQLRRSSRTWAFNPVGS